jgi:hypothetical protein
MTTNIYNKISSNAYNKKYENVLNYVKVCTDEYLNQICIIEITIFMRVLKTLCIEFQTVASSNINIKTYIDIFYTLLNMVNEQIKVLKNLYPDDIGFHTNLIDCALTQINNFKNEK